MMGLPLKSQKGYKPGKLDIKAKQHADKTGSGYGNAKFKGGKSYATSATMSIPVTAPDWWIDEPKVMTGAEAMTAILGGSGPVVQKPKAQYNPYPEPDVEALTQGMTPEELAEMELLTGKKLVKAEPSFECVVLKSDKSTGELTVQVQKLTKQVGEVVTYNGKQYTITYMAKQPTHDLSWTCYYALEPVKPEVYATGGLVTTTHTPEDGITYSGYKSYHNMDLDKDANLDNYAFDVVLPGFEFLPGQLVKFNGENHTVMATGPDGKATLKKGSHFLPHKHPSTMVHGGNTATKGWMENKYKNYGPALLEQEAHKIVKAATGKNLLVGDTINLEGICYEANVTGTGTFIIYQYMPKKLQAFIRAELFRLSMENAGSAYKTLLSIHKQDEAEYKGIPHLYPSAYSSALYEAIHQPHAVDWEAIMSQVMAPDQAMVLTWMMSLSPGAKPKPITNTVNITMADLEGQAADDIAKDIEKEILKDLKKSYDSITGKFSSKGPNIQNVPKDKFVEEGKKIVAKHTKAAMFGMMYGGNIMNSAALAGMSTVGFGDTIGNQLPEPVKHPFCDNPECKYHGVLVAENKTELIDYDVPLDWDSNVQNKLQRYYATHTEKGLMISLCPSCASVVEMLGGQAYEWVPSV